MILDIGAFQCSQQKIWGFPGSSDNKESACNAGDPGSIPGSGRSPGEGNGCTLQSVFLPGERSLSGYSPWGGKDLEMTEQLTLSLSTEDLEQPFQI